MASINIRQNLGWTSANSVALTANTTIGVAHYGKVITNRGASGALVHTLPDVSSALDGSIFWYRGVADHDVSFSTNTAGELITVNNSAATTISLNQVGKKIGIAASFYCDGTSWFGTVEESQGALDTGPFFSADFSGPGAERLNAGNTAFSFSDTEWWIGLWVRSDTSGSTDIIYQQVASGDNGVQFSKLSTETLRLRVYDGVNTIIGTVTTSGTLTTDTWHFVFAYHDSVNNQVGISIDSGSFVTANTTGAAGLSGANFYFGNAATNSWDGQMDEISVGQSPSGGFSTTTPTSIRDALYNSGSGKRYSQLTSLQKTAWGLISHFGLDEVAGTRFDSHGSSDLLDENTVGFYEGKVKP